MQSTTRRRFQATAGILVAGSLIGVQVLAAPANASGTVTWRPGTPPPGTGFWSNTCPTTGQGATGIPNDSSNLHSALTDAQPTVAANPTLVAENGADVAWRYAPSSGQEGGPSITLTGPSTTTSLAASIAGASSGHAMVFYQASGAAAGDYYVGIATVNSPGSTWAKQTVSNFAWYHHVLNQLFQTYSWNSVFPTSILDPTPVPSTIASFANTGGNNNTALPAGAWYASIEMGCTGAFSIDHIQVADGSGITDYDLQNPLSSTTTSTTVPKVGPGGSATINGAVVSDSAPVTTGTVTLQSSTNGGTTWTTGTTQATGTGFTVAPTQTTLYKVNFNGAPEAAASTSSNTVTVQVGPRVTLRANRSTMNVGQAATFTATFAPVRAGITVTFQQLSGTTWQWLGSAVTNSSGIATLTKTRTPSGLWSVRALSTAQQGYTASTVSATTAIKVYQPVSITAYRSVSSVYVGRYFRIYGTVTPHLYGIGLQLQQYLGGRWVVVATGHSGTRGVYSFSKLARTVGVATFRIVAPASGYRRLGGSAAVRVTIVRVPVYTPPPPPPPSGGGGGGGSGIG